MELVENLAKGKTLKKVILYQMDRRMSYFDVEKIVHFSEISIPPPSVSFESRVSIKPKLRAKNFRTEIYIYPEWNNSESMWACELRLFVSHVLYQKGLAKENFVIQETTMTPGEVKKKFRKDISMAAAPYRVG